MAAPTTVVWFRRDLRGTDHPALVDASRRGSVVALYVVDPGLLARRHHRAPVRLRFLRAGLAALDAELASLGGALVVRHGDPATVVPAVVAECGADRVSVTREVSPFGRARDDRVRAALAAAGVAFEEYGGDLLVPPEDLPGPSGAGYRVFTPFYRAWLKAQAIPDELRPERLTGPRLETDDLARILPEEDPPMPAGAAAAASRLATFIDMKDVDHYRDERDLVADDTTSHLSPYLRFGMITSAQIGRALRDADADDWGRDAFWRQVAWREFYHHLLWHRPEAATTAMLPQFRHIEWENDPDHLEAWTRGLTGYPLVDAAMRQLADIGWIHNRARMVAASFLVKDLHVDWRRGETVFMQGLIDGDPANNNGGWQWVASTGTDAAPYFRVMNPVKQAKRYDPEGIYVKRYVPELRRVPLEHIHEPWLMDPEQQKRLGCRIGIEYPERIVDHVLRQRAIVARYREAAPPSEGSE